MTIPGVQEKNHKGGAVMPRKVNWATKKAEKTKSMNNHTLEIPQDIADGLSFYLSRSVFWDGIDCANIVAEEAKCGSALSTKAMEARAWMLNALRGVLWAGIKGRDK